MPATATARPRARPPPDRSPSTGRSCAAPPNPSRGDSSAPGDQDQRVGVVGDRWGCARPVRARRGGHPGRRPRRGGRVEQVHREPGLGGDKDEFDRWSARRLDEVELDDLFRDGSCCKMHPVPGRSRCWPRGASPPRASRCSSGSPRAAASPATPGATSSRTQGPRAALAAADHLRWCQRPEQRRRDQLCPLAAPECLIHRARNLLAKVPAHAQSEVKAAYWQVFDTDDIDLEPGPSWSRLCRPHRRLRRARPAQLPSAVKCLLGDREQLTASLRFPAEHHKRIRHSNFIERTFGETRRRVKVIGRRPGQASCLSLRVGGARPREPPLARVHHDPKRAAPAAGSAPRAARPTRPAATRPTNDQPGEHRTCQSRRLTYPCARTSVRPFTPSLGRHP